MSLFSRKPHVNVEKFCTDFFTNQILSPKISGIDVGSVFTDSVKKSVVEISPSFAAVDITRLSTELTLLRFEMFALAMLHTFGEEIAQHESQLTKEYLTSCGRPDIWDDLIHYNHMISKSVIYEFDPNTSAGKLSRVQIDKMRMDAFDKWIRAGFDGESVARVANRMSSEKSWKSNITPQLLAWKLTERLGQENDEDCRFGLAATIFGFYKGARGEMDGIKIDI
jgi:hypothetical protein